MKKLAALVVAVAMVVAVFAFAAPAMAAGFDQYGYNRTARIFVGTYNEYLAERGAAPDPVYGNDRLVMKWNAEWDRYNAEGYGANPPYDAWCTNQFNGNVPGGSGESETFKNIWVGPLGTPGSYWVDGGLRIWGQFETVFDMYRPHGAGREFLTKAAVPGLGLSY